jgi:methionyl-tRNA synthetase
MTQPSGGVTVIVIPQPTVNGPLHIGHMSGPYLAADVAARAAKARGERVLALAGLDIHPNYVLTKAENLGEDVDEVVARYRAQILSAFDLARISYDAFLDPQDPPYQRAVAGMLTEMVENGSVPMREMTLHECSDCGRTLHHSYVVGKCPVCGTGANGTSCEGCGAFTSAQILVDPSCARCGGSPRPMTVTVPVLPLEDYRDHLVSQWLQGEWPQQLRGVLRQYQNAPLPDYPLAYPTNWGIECEGPLAGMRVDFPAELGFSYLYGPAEALHPGTEGLATRVDAWNEINGIWHFNGMDNTFYFCILYPSILAAAGVTGRKALGATINELYLLDGQKFSTSRNHALWADEFLTAEDPELVRLYLSWDRPDRYESDFTYESYQAFCDYIRPLLDGDGVGNAALPTALVAAELERAEWALRLQGFDSALAIRCTVAALAAGTGLDSAPLAALAGREWPISGSGG